MNYELYIDVFFLVNFFMDASILIISWKILKCSTTYGRICVGAILGSIMTCMVVMYLPENVIVKFILYHGLIVSVMIRAGLRIKLGRQFVGAYLCVYITAVLFGGVLELIKPYLRESSIFFGVSVASYWVVLGIWNIISWLGKRRNDCCEVTLYHQGKEVKVMAIVDTGNRLKDKLTGKAVSVIGREKIQELLGDIPVDGVRFISFHTVGMKDGVMPLISVERMYLHQEMGRTVEKPLLAISAEIVSTDDYELILSPDV